MTEQAPPNAGLMLAHRLRRWANIKPALSQRAVSASVKSIGVGSLITLVIIARINPHPDDHHYCRFYSVLLVDQITVIQNEMCVYTSKFANMCAQIEQI